jgi:hypothetical protein
VSAAAAVRGRTSRLAGVWSTWTCQECTDDCLHSCGLGRGCVRAPRVPFRVRVRYCKLGFLGTALLRGVIVDRHVWSPQCCLGRARLAFGLVPTRVGGGGAWGARYDLCCCGHLGPRGRFLPNAMPQCQWRIFGFLHTCNVSAYRINRTCGVKLKRTPYLVRRDTLRRFSARVSRP